jgi:hypothetical protein
VAKVVFKGIGRYVGSTFRATVHVASGTGAYRHIEGKGLKVRDVNRRGVDHLRLTERSPPPGPPRADHGRRRRAARVPRGDEAHVDDAYPGIFERVASFHNRPQHVMGRRYEGFVSTHEPSFLVGMKYVSDSIRWLLADGIPIDDA